MPMRLPRILRIASAGRLSMRCPRRRTSPPAMRPGGSIRPITAVPVIDLPAPDSPTTPRISPGAMSNDTSSIAVSVPRRVGNSTLRLRTLRTGTVIGAIGEHRLALSQARVQGIAQPVAEQVHRQHECRQRDAGKDRDPPFAGEEILLSGLDQRAERGLRRGKADAEERQRRL